MFKKKRYLQSFLLLIWAMALYIIPINAQAAPSLAASKKAAIGQSFTLTLKNNKNAVKWSISKKGILTQKSAKDNKLRLTAVRTGKTDVTARIAGSKKAYTCHVTVYDPVSVKGSSTLYLNKSCTLSVEGTKKAASFTSSDSKILSVRKLSSGRARVTARGVGTAYISVKASGRTYKHKIKVTKNTDRLKIAIADCNSGEDGLALSAINGLGAAGTIVSWNCDASAYDGLVVPGGVDVNPTRYKERNVASGGINNDQDYMQLSLIKSFVSAGKPVFGICRGHQLINVYFGGSLIQNVPNHGWRMHNVRSEKGSRLWKLYGDNLSVRSSHHQAVKKLGRGLKATQWADDGVIEAIEHRNLPVFAVQWHPELMGSSGAVVLKNFLQECRNYRDQ